MATRNLPPMPEILPPETPPLPDAAPGVAVFATADGSVRVEVRLQGGTIRLSQKQLARLYGVTVSNISKHSRLFSRMASLNQRELLSITQ